MVSVGRLQVNYTSLTGKLPQVRVNEGAFTTPQAGLGGVRQDLWLFSKWPGRFANFFLGLSNFNLVG